MTVMYGDIFVRVILPILVLMGLGVLLQRFRGLEMATLSQLNIYLFVPGFLFIAVYDSQLTFGQIGWICAAVTIATVLLGLLIFAGLRGVGAPQQVVGPVLLASLLYNAGNFGIPVAELLYPVNAAPVFQGMASNLEGPRVQAILVMLSNLTLWLAGYLVLTVAHGNVRAGIAGYLKLPMIYVIVAAFVARWVRNDFFAGGDFLPYWVRFPLDQVKAGLVPVALVTLGAQLGRPPTGPRRWRIVTPTVALKLLALPLATAAVVAGSNWLPWPALRLWPWPGVQLIIASAGPTAVNSLLLTLELKGDAELAASCVFWSTALSAVTCTATIAAMVALAAAPH